MDLRSDRIRIASTKDGSSTLFSERHKAHYHSTHGAIQESLHVFIAQGLLRCPGKNIKILEVGFGTGLNTLLTLTKADELDLEIDYHAIDLHPLSPSIVKGLNYCEMIGRPDLLEVFKSMHEFPWNAIQDIQNNFKLKKYEEDLLRSDLTKEVDLVYFDAFGPGSQPELWAVEVFEKIYANMNIGGILCTYCCKGDVRRAMLSVGFKVEKVPGPPGKREMLVAIK